MTTAELDIEEPLEEEVLDFDEVIPLDVTSPMRWPCMIAPGVARLTKYVANTPFIKQRAYLLFATQEAFYGGAAGGAKSDALLMAALQFADVPGYAALILRKTLQDLNLPEALMDRAADWLGPTDARWIAQKKQWEFPEGGSLTFGYCETDKDVRRYQSAAFQFIGIDESTQFSEWSYRFLFSRLRRPSKAKLTLPAHDGVTLADVPLRMRNAANPGDIGHAWHRRRFVDKTTRKPGIYFVPARAEDNPYIDLPSYEAQLRRMFPTEWLRLRYGDWEVRDPGEIFDQSRIGSVVRPLDKSEGVKRVRYWDMAATEVKPGTDPDYTVGFRLALDAGTGEWCIEHVVAVQKKPSDVEKLMQQTAARDGREVNIVIEQEPGAEGKLFIDYMRRKILRGFKVHGDKVTEPKPARIRMLEPIVNSGDVTCVEAPWTQGFRDQIDAWPHGTKQDQVDAFAGAHRWLTAPKGRVLV